jgi:hypothetical protein
MKRQSWIILYRTADGILYLNGPGDLAEWPHLPVESDVTYVGVQFEDILVHCYYAADLSEADAVFYTRTAHHNGLFST